MGLQSPVRAPDRGPAAGRPRTGAAFRTDIQALRALAVALVVVYHLWPGGVRGGFIGVDVFFVISGFLITTHLYAHPPLSRGDLARFWARRARRLLPAALLVLVVTLVATVLFLPATQWGVVAREVVAATLYVENWQLAATSVDYLAAANAPSPVQHFWSLSVEEQFYVVWPVLLLGLAVLARRRRWPLRPVALAGLGLLTALSLAYCLQATAAEPAPAYFVTPTRLWELGAGAVLALVVAAPERPRPARTWRLAPRARLLLLGTGLALVAVPAFAYSAEQAFPGWRAVLPVAGTVLVIAAAVPQAPTGPGRWMALAPVQKLGDISYSVYLWHWPLVVVLPAALGHPATHLDKVGLLVASLVLGGLSKTLVEDRFRTTTVPPAATLRRAGLAMLTVVLLAGLLLLQTVVQQRADERRLSAALQDPGACFGAAALAVPRACPPTLAGPLVPSAVQAPDDRSDAYARDCFSPAPFAEVRRCVFGDPDGAVSVALVGNSHAGHWLPALQRVAEGRGWKVTTFLASECAATDGPVGWDSAAKQTGCLSWADRVQSATKGGQFDLVVTSERNGRAAEGRTYDASYDAWLTGYRSYLGDWARGGTRLLVVADTATPGKVAVPDCLAQHPDDLLACAGPRSVWVPRDPQLAAARELDSPRVQTVDLNDHLCEADRCPAAVGGVTVYSDASHLTRTYAATLAPYLEPALLRALG